MIFREKKSNNALEDYEELIIKGMRRKRLLFSRRSTIKGQVLGHSSDKQIERRNSLLLRTSM